jgi:hypothetical protein
LVNLDILREIERRTQDEKRKLTVVMSLADKEEQPTPKTLALIHLHAVVDMGASRGRKTREASLRERLDLTWPLPYAVELKQTFKRQSLVKKLAAISSYLTKGGNEDLRFKTGFGRELDSDLDGIEWRRGLGKKDRGGETLPDERGLVVGDVIFLHQAYQWLMHRKNGEDGYVIEFGEPTRDPEASI